MPRRKKDCDNQTTVSKNKTKKKDKEQQPQELSRNHLIPSNSYRENVYNKFFIILNKYNQSTYNYSLDEIQKFALNI